MLCGKIFGKSVAFSNLEADQVRKEPVSLAKIILEHSQHGSSGCSLIPLTRDHKGDIKSGVFGAGDIILASLSTCLLGSSVTAAVLYPN